MAKKNKEFDEGYKAAIEAIKKSLQSQQDKTGSSGNNQQLDPDMQPVPGQGDENQQDNNQSEDQSRGNGEQGTVRPEDCIGPDSLSDVPGQAGGMIDRSTGEKIATDEGYEKTNASEGAIEAEWKDAAIKAASQMKGDSMGQLKSKIEGLYKTSTDWKKALKNIIGHSLSPEDKRQAYANKNVLVSQDRIARTDKDKYDNVDYIMAFVDSSGSMSDDQLRLCLSEVYQIALKKKPIKIVVVQCDTKIQDIQEYTNVKQLEKELKSATVKGRGGTELKPCWDLLMNDKRYKKRPTELAMVFTDGYLNQYKRNPRTMKHLCWVILDNPSFNVQYKDTNTKCIHINTKDIK